MDTSTPPAQKKGLGPLAWIGMGCGGIILLVIIGIVVASMMFGPQFKKFVEDASKNPTRATATTMVQMGIFELVAEDDVNKRYTVREKKSGQLTTIYWDERQKKPLTISGDFSAIPKDTGTPNEPAPAPEPAPK